MIRNFIYLDEPKLYSFSSQLFEGITEYVLSEEALEKEDAEQFDGKSSSSRIIADVIRESSKSATKKFLHDHSFTLFEEKLKSENKLLDINSLDSREQIESSISDFSFVKIKGQMLVSDMEEIVKVFRNFNDLGENIVLSQMQSELLIIEQKHVKSNVKDKDKAIEGEFFKTYNVKEKALEQGLRQPKIWQQSLTDMIEFGAGDTLQFHQHLQGTLFSSYIDRQHLREPLPSIIRKYARLTQREFVVLGVISHKYCDDPFQEEHPLGDTPSNDLTDMKTRLRAMAASMLGISKFTYGLEHNEVVIEPIAVYTEL